MNSQNSGSVKTRTPGDWRIIEFPGREDRFFIAAKPYEGHPYFERTMTIEIMSDEDYPTKRADAEFIVRAVNSHDALVAALKIARQHLAHDVSCVGINPTKEWAEKGSVHANNCACEIKQVDAAIAKAEAPCTTPS